MATLREVVDGLNILAKYGRGDQQGVEGRHDIIFTTLDLEDLQISAEDQAALEALGWHFDEEINSWARFT